MLLANNVGMCGLRRTLEMNSQRNLQQEGYQVQKELQRTAA